MEGSELDREVREVCQPEFTSFDDHSVNKQTQERSFLYWHGWETGFDYLFKRKSNAECSFMVNYCLV